MKAEFIESELCLKRHSDGTRSVVLLLTALDLDSNDGTEKTIHLDFHDIQAALAFFSNSLETAQAFYSS